MNEKTNYHPKGCFYAAEEERKKRIFNSNYSSKISSLNPCGEQIINGNNLEQNVDEHLKDEKTQLFRKTLNKVSEEFKLGNKN